MTSPHPQASFASISKQHNKSNNGSTITINNKNNNNEYLAMAPEFEEQMKNNPYFQPVIDVNQFHRDSKNIIDTKKSSSHKSDINEISKPSMQSQTSIEDITNKSNRSQSLALDTNNPKFINVITSKHGGKAADTMMTNSIIHNNTSRQPRRQFMLDSVTNNNNKNNSKLSTKKPVTTKRKRTISTEKAQTRGFAKRDDNKSNKSTKKDINNNKQRTLQRRRSSGKKNRSFTPQSVSKVLPAKLEENNIINNEKQGRDKFDDVFIIRIEEWLKTNNLWFANEKGEKLLICLLESGIENPEEDLSILSAYPDLHEIAAMANLNILQRRKFINAAHLNVNQFDNIKNQQQQQQQESVKEEKQINIDDNKKSKKLGFRKRNENKQVVVMSAEEQEALARMDSIIEQLQNTRNLIKKRILSINNGGLAYEKIIRSEFEILKDLLRQREEQLVDEMKFKINNKISGLSQLDYDLLLSLQICQKSKIEAQKLMKTNEQPRVSRQKWRVLMGRKKKVTNLIEDTITNEIINNKNENINKLIISTMSMNDIMPTLPQPLIAQHLSHNFENKSLSAPYQFPHHHKRHYDNLNPYLLNIFTKNQAQLHLQMSVPGFAFNYTQRSQMHKVCLIIFLRLLYI